VKRTRAQQRLRRKGYTHESAPLRQDPLQERLGIPKVIFIFKSGSQHNGGPDTPRKIWRDYQLPGDVVRPVAKHYIHKGGKP
jgi:hypothetical protein